MVVRIGSLLSVGSLSLCVVAAAAAPALAVTPTIVTVQSARWQPGTGAFKGLQVATIVGDPKASGEYYSYLIKMPDGVRVPPHFHAQTENVNVISGTLLVGVGDTVNAANMMPLGAGAIVSIPAGLHHYAMSKGPTIVEVSGVGPDVLTPVRQ
ncbi:MAG: cupin domain-containing protein [Candidatus Eremiobacteraeota bacterium]|nr:cupin domain-containing protein [Candidatus Eremiobacteraeota bacterium]